MSNSDPTQPDSPLTEPAVATPLPRALPAHSPSLSKCRVRDEVRWRVRWHETGRIKRKFFTGRESADAFITRLRGETITARTRLAALPQDEQETLWRAYTIAQERNLNLVDLLTLAEKQTPVQDAPSIKSVITEMLATKLKAGRAQGYLNIFRTVLDQFAKGRESKPINQFTLPEIEKFIESKNIAYRSTIRARLSTLFQFALRRGYRLDNPCARLENITIAARTPEILKLKEIRSCLKWFKKHPRSMAWFVLSSFAGLRPEEAAKTTWAMINFAEGWIRVEAQTSKIRQRRVVYPPPMALAWLQAAKKSKAALPLPPQQLKRARKQLRALLRWKKWKHDCTRHTAASYWLAHAGSTATVATALGHSESILRKHYMALVTKADAEKFWKLAP